MQAVIEQVKTLSVTPPAAVVTAAPDRSLLQTHTLAFSPGAAAQNTPASLPEPTAERPGATAGAAAGSSPPPIPAISVEDPTKSREIAFFAQAMKHRRKYQREAKKQAKKIALGRERFVALQDEQHVSHKTDMDALRREHEQMIASKKLRAPSSGLADSGHAGVDEMKAGQGTR